ncbi:hypothetical protein BY996DRAFT_735028 [Phakopsora pachyrhizi]|nr:hypothetical protein BY996DRAFT_735028 [Phakopsora pachyrhizi]
MNAITREEELERERNLVAAYDWQNYGKRVAFLYLAQSSLDVEKKKKLTNLSFHSGKTDAKSSSYNYLIDISKKKVGEHVNFAQPGKSPIINGSDGAKIRYSNIIVDISKKFLEIVERNKKKKGLLWYSKKKKLNKEEISGKDKVSIEFSEALMMLRDSVDEEDKPYFQLKLYNKIVDVDFLNWVGVTIKILNHFALLSDGLNDEVEKIVKEVLQDKKVVEMIKDHFLCDTIPDFMGGNYIDLNDFINQKIQSKGVDGIFKAFSTKDKNDLISRLMSNLQNDPDFSYLNTLFIHEPIHTSFESTISYAETSKKSLYSHSTKATVRKQLASQLKWLFPWAKKTGEVSKSLSISDTDAKSKHLKNYSPTKLRNVERLIQFFFNPAVLEALDDETYNPVVQTLIEFIACPEKPKSYSEIKGSLQDTQLYIEELKYC